MIFSQKDPNPNAECEPASSHHKLFSMCSVDAAVSL